MDLGNEKRTAKEAGKRLAFLLCLTALLLTASVLLSDHFALKEQQLGYPGAAVLFLSAAAFCAVFGKYRRREQILMSGALFGLVSAVILLMIGFLCNADRMSTAGIIRVSTACLGGCLTGVWLGSKGRGKKGEKTMKRFQT